MARQNIYLSDKAHNLISLDNVNLLDDVMLLDAGCGYGKTTLILDGSKSEDSIRFLELINEKRKEQGLTPTTYRRTLIATSRTITHKQMQHDIDTRLFGGNGEAQTRTNPFSYESEMAWGSESAVCEDDIPQITTFAKLAKMIMKGHFDSSYYDMIVIDEAHSLILDSTFADDNFYLLKWLEETKGIMKLFMTATPFIWQKFVAENENLAAKYNFKTINKPLPPKYQSDKVKFHYGTTLDTVLKNYMINNAFDEDNKCVAFASSASGAARYMVNDKTGRTMALISIHTDKEITLSEEQEANIRSWELEESDEVNRRRFFEKLENDRKVKIVDIMNLRKSWVDRIVENGMLPNEAILLLATSAYREGISILDKRLKYMGSEFPDEASLRQAIARGRHNGLSDIFIVLNGNFRSKIEKQRADMEEYLLKYKQITDKELQQQMNLVRFEQQKTSMKDGTPRAKIVMEIKRTLENGEVETRYEINHYLYTYYLYMEYHFTISDITPPIKELDSEGFVISETKIEYKSAWTGEPLPTWKEYYSNLLKPYSREQIVNFTSGSELRKEIREKLIEHNNAQKAATLEELVIQYLNVKITSEIKKEFVAVANDMGFMRSKKRVVGWTTIKGEIEKLGYRVIDKRTKTERYAIIENK